MTAALIRWVSLVGLAVLIGALTLEAVLVPLERVELARGRSWVHWLAVCALVVLLLASIAQLLSRAETMAGGRLGSAIAAVPRVLRHTHFGTIWLVRGLVLVLLLLLRAVASRSTWFASLVLALALAVTTALTGHAADAGDLTVSVLADWMHIVAGGAWAGGLVAVGIVLLGHRDAHRLELLEPLGRRFSRVAALGLLAVVATGTVNASAALPSVSALWTTNYGRVLAVKIVMVLAMAALGALNRWALLPRLRSVRRALPRLVTTIGAEGVLAVLVLACTAVLGESTPARHEGHTHGAPEAEHQPIHTTMDALHAAGGVPPGWMFQVPAGKAERGREVFMRVGCYACHRVDGEHLPPPTGPGPDLTDMGAHHPAGYLAESILNPDAVIVDGPGYTRADGRSTMPDYRDRLSVADLIDLVAYLKGLKGD